MILNTNQQQACTSRINACSNMSLEKECACTEQAFSLLVVKTVLEASSTNVVVKIVARQVNTVIGANSFSTPVHARTKWRRAYASETSPIVSPKSIPSTPLCNDDLECSHLEQHVNTDRRSGQKSDAAIYTHALVKPDATCTHAFSNDGNYSSENLYNKLNLIKKQTTESSLLQKTSSANDGVPISIPISDVSHILEPAEFGSIVQTKRSSISLIDRKDTFDGKLLMRELSTQTFSNNIELNAIETVYAQAIQEHDVDILKSKLRDMGNTDWRAFRKTVLATSYLTHEEIQTLLRGDSVLAQFRSQLAPDLSEQQRKTECRQRFLAFHRLLHHLNLILRVNLLRCRIDHSTRWIHPREIGETVDLVFSSIPLNSTPQEFLDNEIFPLMKQYTYIVPLIYIRCECQMPGAPSVEDDEVDEQIKRLNGVKPVTGDRRKRSPIKMRPSRFDKKRLVPVNFRAASLEYSASSTISR